MSCFSSSSSSRGYMTLFSVLVLSVAAVSVAVSLIFSGLTYSRSGYSLQEAAQAVALANLCAEEALERVRADENFSGTGSVTVTHGSCNYEVFDLGGENRRIDSVGVVNDVQRRARVVIDQLFPTISIVSWQDVESF